MIGQTQNNLQMRGFISLLTALSFLIMTVSGIILFVTPLGRVAYWTDWRLLGISKAQWGDMHITTSLLFALSGLWHVWFNWRVLLNYFRNKVERTIALKLELAIAAIVTLFFTVGAIYKTPPLNYILSFNDYLKAGWVKDPDYDPPFGHAELLPLRSFVKKVDMELAPALEELKKNNIKISGADEKLDAIARNNGVSPVEIFKIIKKQQLKTTESVQAAPPAASASSSKLWTPELVQQRFEGKGVGRKTLSDICLENGLDQVAVVRKLGARNISMSPGDTLKKTADASKELPIELLKIILVGEKLP